MRTQLGPLILDEVFRRFPWFFKPERARGNHGTVEWRVAAGDGEPARYFVRIKNVECWVERESADPPRTTLELDAADCVRLVTGQASPAILLLSGRLRVSSDEDFAIEQAGFFSLPTASGEERPAGIDSFLGGIDVDEIARVVSETPDAQLREAIRGPFRKLLLEELFRRIPEYFDGERADSMTATIDWRVNDAEARDRYLVVIAGGACRVADRAVPGPRVQLSLGAADLLKLATGNANPVAMVLRRRLRLGGDLLMAPRLLSAFRIPSPA
jgi:putative sterol carrier protein